MRTVVVLEVSDVVREAHCHQDDRYNAANHWQYLEHDRYEILQQS